MNAVRALVLTGFGINCEEEMAAAYRLCGAHADIVHLNDVFAETVSIHDYDILNFPGGFSFGDDLGSGRVLANKLRYRRRATGRLFRDDLGQFLAAGNFILGVCNGFQALVKMGLLPNVGGAGRQEVTLTHNDSGRFADRFVTVRNTGDGRCPFLTGIDLMDLPVRHGEGKLVITDPVVRERVVAAKLNCLTYVDAAGDVAAHYPDNPNGAALACAGLTDETGRILGLMPHPEAYLSLFNHPNWARRRREHPESPETGEGLKLFENIVRHVAATRPGRETE